MLMVITDHHTGESPLHFRKLDPEGLKTLVAWAGEEGWNPGTHDAGLFWATDPEGFYGYFMGDRLVAGGSVVSYNGLFGFMGFFMVRPAFRAQGIGRRLWYRRRDLLLSRLSPGAAIGMDGVVAMQPFYRKGGFEIAFRDERYELAGSAFAVDPNISPVREEDHAQVLALDRQCFGFPRPQFLIPWLKAPNAQTFKYAKDGVLEGFAVVRKALKGYKIGPLFACNAPAAEEILRACLNSSPGEPFFLDIPVVNSAALELAKKYNATYTFECARMYHGTAPDLATGRIFGLTTFELG